MEDADSVIATSGIHASSCFLVSEAIARVIGLVVPRISERRLLTRRIDSLDGFFQDFPVQPLPQACQTSKNTMCEPWLQGRDGTFNQGDIGLDQRSGRLRYWRFWFR